MDKTIECPCGYTIRAGDEETLVSQAQEHAREMHRMELTREQALAMSQPA